jgi:spore coat polysaccharide biosynthesis predicted glycosyltransferase SpsG
MVNMLKIIIVTSGNHKIGMGHIFRCLNLAENLNKEKHEIIFLTNNKFSKNIISEKNNCKYYRKLNTKNMRNFLKTFTPEIIILDKLNETKSNIQFLQTFCPIVAIDYTGKNKEKINYGINILYHKTGIKKNSISNFNYAVLNKNFLKKKKSSISKQVKSIIVLQGGSDTYCFTPKIVRALNKIDKDFKITIVLGPSFKCWSKLNNILNNSNKSIQVFHDTKNISMLMHHSDLAITAGGNTLLELAYLGIPSIVVCAEKFEIETAKLMQKKNFGINLGFGRNLSSSKIQSCLITMIDDYKLRKKMNKTGPLLVDGKGNQRILKYIESKIIPN